MQMKTSHNTIDPLELCTICERNINVPSAELVSLASIQDQTQKMGRIVLRRPGNSGKAMC